MSIEIKERGERPGSGCATSIRRRDFSHFRVFLPALWPTQSLKDQYTCYNCYINFETLGKTRLKL